MDTLIPSNHARGRHTLGLVLVVPQASHVARDAAPGSESETLTYDVSPAAETCCFHSFHACYEFSASSSCQSLPEPYNENGVARVRKICSDLVECTITRSYGDSSNTRIFGPGWEYSIYLHWEKFSEIFGNALNRLQFIISTRRDAMISRFRRPTLDSKKGLSRDRPRTKGEGDGRA